MKHVKLGSLEVSRIGSSITGSDLLVDGGVIASIAAGRYQVRIG